MDEGSDSDGLEKADTKNSKPTLDQSPLLTRQKPALREGFAIETKDSEDLSLFECYTKNSTIYNYDRDQIKAIWEGKKIRRMD